MPKLPATSHPDLALRIDSIVENARHEFKLAGVSLVVMRGRAVVVSKGYGLANMSTGTPATDRTIYGIGSLSKQITAAAIMKLVEDGRVQLDAPVATYLPELAVARDTTLRIRSLLRQTSGLSVFDDYPEVDTLGSGPDSTMFPFHRVVTMIGAHAPLYPPDSWWSYNNSNYTLLAAVIERVTGLTYDEYLARVLFRPLGMNVTRSCSPTAGTDPARAVGYEIAGDSLVVRPTTESRVPSMTGPGGLCSSVAELANWTRALVDGRAVTPASYRTMTSTRAVDAGVYGTFTPPYGFGVSVLPFAGQAAVWHTGVREGFMSVLVYLPKQDIIVAAATNTRHTLIDALAVRIVRELLATPAPANLNLAISAREAARTIGSYDDEMFKLRVFQDSSRLFVEVPDLGVREQLLYQGDHLFVATGPRELRFQFDSVQGPTQRVDWEWSELRAYGKRTK
jgi:CubicO group peptidase (beta-lactamase class C family)